MKKFVMLVPAALLLAACGNSQSSETSSQPLASTAPASTPAATPSTSAAAPTGNKGSFEKVEELRDAYVAAGGSCPTWVLSNVVETAIESGDCSDSSVLSIYSSTSEASDAAETIRDLNDQAGMDSTLLLGENWIIIAEDVATVEPVLGGILITGTATTDSSSASETPEPSSAPAYSSSDFKPVTGRTWKLIVKNPDGRQGETIQIYGVITQFDAATGTEEFRADAGPSRKSDPYDYTENALFSGTDKKLANFVEDDIFVAKVIVTGAYTYDTQAGGVATVPQFEIYSIKRIG